MKSPNEKHTGICLQAKLNIALSQVWGRPRMSMFSLLLGSVGHLSRIIYHREKRKEQNILSAVCTLLITVVRPSTRNIEHELLVVFWSGKNVRNLLDIQEKYLSICSLTCDTNKIFRCQYKILCDLIFDCEHHRFCSSIIMWCLWCIKFPLLCRN